VADNDHLGERYAADRAADENIRAEVESLLAFGKDAKDFMEASALQMAAKAFAEEDVAPQAPEETDD